MAKFTSSSKLSHGTDAGLGSKNSLFTQVKGVLWMGLFLLLLALVWTIIATPQLRGWGLGGLALVVVGVATWRWRKRATAPSLDESLSDLGEA